MKMKKETLQTQSLQNTAYRMETVHDLDIVSEPGAHDTRMHDTKEEAHSESSSCSTDGHYENIRDSQVPSNCSTVTEGEAGENDNLGLIVITKPPNLQTNSEAKIKTPNTPRETMSMSKCEFRPDNDMPTRHITLHNCARVNSHAETCNVQDDKPGDVSYPHGTGDGKQEAYNVLDNKSVMKYPSDNVKNEAEKYTVQEDGYVTHDALGGLSNLVIDAKLETSSDIDVSSTMAHIYDTINDDLVASSSSSDSGSDCCFKGALIVVNKSENKDVTNNRTCVDVLRETEMNTTGETGDIPVVFTSDDNDSVYVPDRPPLRSTVQVGIKEDKLGAHSWNLKQ